MSGESIRLFGRNVAVKAWKGDTGEKDGGVPISLSTV